MDYSEARSPRSFFIVAHKAFRARRVVSRSDGVAVTFRTSPSSPQRAVSELDLGEVLWFWLERQGWRGGMEPCRSRPPTWMLFQALWATLVLVFLLLQVSPLVNRVTEDESLLVYDSMRVAQGQVPYRDFFSLWTPGGFYVLSGGPWGWWGRPETGTRYLQVAVVFLFTILLVRALRRWGGWAWPAAALLPLVLLPMAPFMGNHWFAVLAYSGAIVAADRIGRSPEAPWAWPVMGFLAGTAGCMMQTEGVLALALVLLVALLGGGAGRRVTGALLRTLAGGALAVGLWLGPLVLRGGAPVFIRDAVLWPLTNYRKPGNVADLPFLADLPSRFAGLWARAGQGLGSPGLVETVTGTVAYASILAAAGVFVLLSIASLLTVLRRKDAVARQRTTASLLTLLGIFLFWRTNPTWVHFVYTIAPLLLLWLLVPSEGWIRRWNKVVGTAMVVALALGGVYHLCPVLRGSRALWEYTDVDRVDRESPLNMSLRGLPFMTPGDTIAVLPSGSNNYLYTFPAAIGYTQLFVLELRHHTVQDHERVASQIAQNRPKLIILHRICESSFMDESDPISHEVKTGYNRWNETPAVAIYLRKDVATGLPKDLAAPSDDGGHP
jgi:hypothetical protein